MPNGVLANAHMQELLSAGQVKGIKTGRTMQHESLRRLTTKLVVTYDKLPASFHLKGVQCDDKESCGAGAFADVFKGKWEGKPVALKRLRVEAKSIGKDQPQQKVCAIDFIPYFQVLINFQKFCRESVMWRGLGHKFVLPFFGVSEDAFELSICMVIPWMEHGNIRHYLDEQRRAGVLTGFEFIKTVDQAVRSPRIDLSLL